MIDEKDPRLPDLTVYCIMCSGNGFDESKPAGKDADGHLLYDECEFCGGMGYTVSVNGAEILKFLRDYLPKIFPALKP